MDGDKNSRERLKRRSEELASYRQMPLQERLEKLSEFKRQRAELEEKVQDTDVNIFALETMPDVAEYRVVRDEIAMDLMETLKETGSIPYLELEKKYRGVNTAIVTTYLSRLKIAQLIQMEPDKKNPSDMIIKLTERGRTLKYVPTK